MKDDVHECELYPSKEIQIRDRYRSHKPEFIALSEAQQTQVQKEELENFSRWMKSDIAKGKRINSSIKKCYYFYEIK